MILVAIANACQGWGSLPVPLPLHQQCSPRAGGDPAVTCSGGCGWGSAGGDPVTLPGSLGHAGAVGRGDAAGSMW